MIRYALRIALVIIALAIVITSAVMRRNANLRLTEAEHQAIEGSAAAARILASHHDVVSEVRVPFGTTFTGVLRSAGVDSQLANDLTTKVRSVVSLRKLKAGQRLVFVRRFDGVLKHIGYRNGWDTEVQIDRIGDEYTAHEEQLTASEKIEVVEGTIENSLFESVIAAGEHPELAVRLAEIFAFDLDFYTDPQPGDTFRLVVEKRTVPGDDAPSYGRIFAAEYVNGHRPFDAVLFHDPSGRPAYYTADGKSLQKQFLKSPLKFAARISSHYSLHRLHPVAKVYRAHLGTDYAVPVGTPVQAIANGRVQFAARKGGNGNLIIVRHSNGYTSYYLHLSRILVRRGQSVQQGQRIALSGMTGLASGPHLDFRLNRNSKFLDFEHMKLPPSSPVSAKEQAAFFAERDKWVEMLHTSHNLQKQYASSVTPAQNAATD